METSKPQILATLHFQIRPIRGLCVVASVKTIKESTWIIKMLLHTVPMSAISRHRTTGGGRMLCYGISLLRRQQCLNAYQSLLRHWHHRHWQCPQGLKHPIPHATRKYRKYSQAFILKPGRLYSASVAPRSCRTGVQSSQRKGVASQISFTVQ
jgi:hypothetical protein